MDTNNSRITKSQKGFSLVELSIVLVVIGIIVGIVTAGVTIQKTSELRSIVSQVDQLKVAMDAFEGKYEDLPGDMSDAHDYWDDGADGVCGTATQCNGNGDGDIDIGTNGSDSESIRAWQHLSLSGIIDGQFTGVGSGVALVPFENTPGTSRTGGGYHVQSLNQYNANMDNVNQVNGTNISVGGFTSGSWPRGKLLSPSEAFYIDNKTDDGDPDDGRTQSRDYYESSWRDGCLDDNVDDGERQYVKTTEDNLCIMFFEIR